MAAQIIDYKKKISMNFKYQLKSILIKFTFISNYCFFFLDLTCAKNYRTHYWCMLNIYLIGEIF